jgi:hypothetical protein
MDKVESPKNCFTHHNENSLDFIPIFHYVMALVE